VPPPPSPAWANFSIIMECTQESGRCQILYSVISTITYKGGEYAPAERADALPLFLLYSFMYSVFSTMERGGAGSKIAHVG
jgi:hypothetical protein